MHGKWFFNSGLRNEKCQHQLLTMKNEKHWCRPKKALLVELYWYHYLNS